MNLSLSPTPSHEPQGTHEMQNQAPTSRLALIQALSCPDVRNLALACQDSLADLAQLKSVEIFVADALDAAETNGTDVTAELKNELGHLVAEVSRSEDAQIAIDADISHHKAALSAQRKGWSYNLFAKTNHLERLRKEIAQAPNTRAGASEKYRKAGLSAGQIAAIGIEPSVEAEAGWIAEADQLEIEIQAITDGLADKTGLATLAGIELIPLPEVVTDARPAQLQTGYISYIVRPGSAPAK
jgi:uncharacterized protein GlcG (DUF336 family)